ncbi:MAG: hypothetical protein WBB23_10105 [Desulforhopalus sp.]
MNPLLLETMLKEKRRELLEEAERQRLVAIYNADNPGWWAKFQLILGDLLIHQGERIKARYSRPLALDTDICRGD